MLIIQLYMWFPYLARLELEISLVIRDVLCYLVLCNGRNSIERHLDKTHCFCHRWWFIPFKKRKSLWSRK
jgi:hypothetical protein